MAIRILIADDHAVFRSGLRALLLKEPDFEVVAEAGTAGETNEQLKAHEIDILVLDLTMPGGQSGSRIAETALSNHPELAIVVLTMHEDEYYLREMFEIGVRGYVLKKSSADDLVAAVRAAHRGESYVDSSLGGNVLAAIVAPQKRRPQGRLDLLTPREREVCQLLALGHTNVETGAKLSISERTVETHRNNIMSKLHLKSRAELVRFAMDNGLLAV